MDELSSTTFELFRLLKKTDLVSFMAERNEEDKRKFVNILKKTDSESAIAFEIITSIYDSEKEIISSIDKISELSRTMKFFIKSLSSGFIKMLFSFDEERNDFPTIFELSKKRRNIISTMKRTDISSELQAFCDFFKKNLTSEMCLFASRIFSDGDLYHMFSLNERRIIDKTKYNSVVKSGIKFAEGKASTKKNMEIFRDFREAFETNGRLPSFAKKRLCLAIEVAYDSSGRNKGMYMHFGMGVATRAFTELKAQIANKNRR